MIHGVPWLRIKTPKTTPSAGLKRMVSWGKIKRMVRWVKIKRMVRWVKIKRMLSWVKIKRIDSWVKIKRMLRWVKSICFVYLQYRDTRPKTTLKKPSLGHVCFSGLGLGFHYSWMWFRKCQMYTYLVNTATAIVWHQTSNKERFCFGSVTVSGLRCLQLSYCFVYTLKSLICISISAQC